MSQEDQDFAQFVVSHIANDFKRVGESANYLLEAFDTQLENVREAVTSTSWVAEGVRKVNPNYAPRPPKPAIPASYVGRLQHWVDNHRALTAAIFAFTGTGAFIIWRSRRATRRNRRARRAPNKAKTEVVVLSGSPYSPLTKSIALSLESRGFLIYIPAGSLDEVATIGDMQAADIQPLRFDITSPESTAEMIRKFTEHLKNPQRHGTASLHLASLILLPSWPSTHGTGSLQCLTPQAWSEELNTHILYPISITHAFLPLLLAHVHHTSATTSLILATPSTIPSIHPLGHAPECLANAALISWLTSLHVELPSNLQPTHIRLGDFDLMAIEHSEPGVQDVALARISRFQGAREAASSPNNDRPALAGTKSSKADKRSRRAKEASELHNKFFDAVVGRSTGTIYIGRGARTYSLVGKWAPTGLVGWMMGEQDAGTVGRILGSSIRRGSESSDDGGVGSWSSAQWERVYEPRADETYE